MKKVYSVKDVKSTLSEKKIDDILLLLDVDDTLIVPTSPMYNTYPHIISDIKSLIKKASGDKKTADRYIDLIARWRLYREVILVDEDWVSFINDMRPSIYALTQMDTGTFGQIDSMEKWRYNDLLSLGILFEKANLNENPVTIIGDATLYGGIYFAGKCTKGEVVKKIMEKINKKIICLVDDNIKYLQSVADACNEMNIEFIGLHFVPPKFEMKFDSSIATAIELELLSCIK